MRNGWRRLGKWIEKEGTKKGGEIGEKKMERDRGAYSQAFSSLWQALYVV